VIAEVSARGGALGDWAAAKDTPPGTTPRALEWKRGGPGTVQEVRRVLEELGERIGE
jgi:hypothetical protein